MHTKKTSCAPDCPVQKAAALLEGKWTMLLVRDLLSGPKRYSQLRDSVGEISPRVLASRLQHLTKAGVVSRKVFPTVPPRTEYRLTKTGRQLQPVFAALARFGTQI